MCQSCDERNLLTLSTKREGAFLSDGSQNFRKGPEKFRAHEKSQCHQEAVFKYATFVRGVNVLQHLSDQKAKDMVQARDALLVIVSTLRLLVRQGLAVRGHEDIDSNFIQTLQVRMQEMRLLQIG